MNYSTFAIFSQYLREGDRRFFGKDAVKKADSLRNPLQNRRDKIRTCDLYVPNVALYQAEPHAVIKYVTRKLSTLK